MKGMTEFIRKFRIPMIIAGLAICISCLLLIPVVRSLFAFVLLVVAAAFPVIALLLFIIGLLYASEQLSAKKRLSWLFLISMPTLIFLVVAYYVWFIDILGNNPL